ncbi:MAG: protease modulator HflC [Clostridia bacterium]|nr:protease modulator HflC [Clostridia bacterium]
MDTERFGSDGTPKYESKNKKSNGWIGWAIALVVLMIGLSSIVVCAENNYKLVRRFGKVERVVTNAGLSFKIPFIESVDTIPKEILIYDLPASDVITSDKKTMIIDSYVLWRVTDPLKFAQTLSFSVTNAENRIDTWVYNAMKNTISNMTQDEVIKSRDGKMTITVTEDETIGANDLVLEEEKEKVVEIKSLKDEIMEQVGNDYEQYGIVLMSVDVKKLDLPADNQQAVYNRMISERENIAAQYTAEGESEARMIQNTTDKEVSIMLSEAEAKAESTIAEGEAEYMNLLSEAYNDASKSEFYTFVRSLDAAKASMKGNNKTLILPADSPVAEVFMGTGNAKTAVSVPVTPRVEENEKEGNE